MILDPDRYECPEHHADLTGLVEEALEGQRTVAYGRPLRGRQVQQGPDPFKVIVTCPGAGDKPAPHSLTCTGTQTP